MAIVNFGKRFTSGFDEDALVTFTNGEHILNFGYARQPVTSQKASLPSRTT